MVCAACSSEMSTSTRFCPQCGNPGPSPEPTAGATSVRTGDAGALRATPSAPTQVLETPVERSDRDATATQPAAVVAPRTSERGAAASARAAAAVAPARRWLADSGLEVQLAIAGTLLVLIAFFFLPFVGQLGTAAEIGGRVWWRPITAVIATVLLVLALRREISAGGAQARVASALALATAGATEAGLLGLVTGNGQELRAGYHVMLLGMVLVLVAAFLATRHPVRRLSAGG